MPYPQYDEYGNPLQPKDWITEAFQSGQVGGPNVTPEAAPTPAPAPDGGGDFGSGGVDYGKMMYGGNKARSTNPLLAENGVNTQNNNINDVAARQAQGYRSGEEGYVSNTGQGRPQQFGTAEPDHSDEGPISPAEVAERMPSDPNAITKLLTQHMLPMAPKASRDGYQNYVTASRQARAAEKAQLNQQGAVNREQANQKDGQAWQQTLLQNALQGAGPLAGGGQSANTASGFGGGGPVLKIGRYTFVGGRWRQETPEEQASVNLKNSQAGNVGASQQLGQAKLLNEIIQQKQNEADRAANRDLRGREVSAREDDMAFRHDEKSQNEAQRLRDLIARDVTEMQAREKEASTQSGWIWDSHYDRGTPEWMNRVDRSMVADNQGKLKPGDRLPGSYQRLGERATQNAQRLMQLQQQAAEAYRKSPQYRTQQQKFQQTKNPADDPDLSIPSHQFDIPDDVATYLQSLKKAKAN